MDKNECKDNYSEPETEEHLNGKRDLFEWIKKQNGDSNAALEGRIPETKQRPDIMFEYESNHYDININDNNSIKSLLLPYMKQCLEKGLKGNQSYRIMEVIRWANLAYMNWLKS